MTCTETPFGAFKSETNSVNRAPGENVNARRPPGLPDQWVNVIDPAVLTAFIPAMLHHCITAVRIRARITGELDL